MKIGRRERILKITRITLKTTRIKIMIRTQVT